MDTIRSRLATLFGGKAEHRLLFIGLDASGRTHLLYLLKLGEAVTTIPTIGFNVETITYKKTDLTIWDVGGCDKIRPLWRHYFMNTNCVWFFVDSKDRERMDEVVEMFKDLMNEKELEGSPVLVLVNKKDLEGGMSVEEVEERLEVGKLRGKIDVKCLGISGRTRQGVTQALDWTVEALNGAKSKEKLSTSVGKEAGGKSSDKASGAPGERDEGSVLEEWLNVVDEDDDEFLEKLLSYQLDKWDHRTHLRIAWLYLKREGRQKGMQLIFDGIKNFIANSDRTKRSRGTTFHTSMTYFWTHMVHFAIESNKTAGNDFKTFLLLNPQLSNGGLFLHYYTKKLMLETPEPRNTVVLPDKHQLPSIIGGTDQLPANTTALNNKASMEEATDKDFLDQVLDGSLDKWSHECYLRFIWTTLASLGRKKGLNVVFEEMKKREAESFHYTITYFWVQMISLVLAMKTSEETTFKTLVDNPQYTQHMLQKLLSSKTYFLEYYKKDTIFSEVAQEGMVLPDIKPLPNVIKK